MIIKRITPRVKKITRSPHRWLLIVVGMTLGLSLWLAGSLWLADNPVNRTKLASTEDLNHFPEPVYVTSRILIGGDVFVGRRIQLRALADPLGYAFPFSGLSSLERGKYDNWIANLECPSTDREVPMSQQETLLRFNCQPAFLAELGKWFNIVSLANNHTDNVLGQTGLDETRTHLEAYGIQYFGHFDNAVSEDLCEIVEIEAKIIYDNGLLEPTSMPIALCGYHGVFKVPTDSEIAVISQFAQYLPTIVMPHMGAEYQSSSDTLRENVYRSMIDHGADVIAGGHPHWVQNTESYQGKLIVYSMGNLIFDQQFNADVTRSLMLDLTLTIPFDNNIQEWIALAPQCHSFHDQCLTTAQSQNLVEPVVSYGYGMIATQNDGFIARKATDAVASAVAVRADWDLTVSSLAP